MDNQPPPRRPSAPPPVEHYQQPQQFAMSNDVAGRIVDAYKTSPMLTGLLLLNLLIFCGAGWYLNVVQDRTANYVKQRDQDLKELLNKFCLAPQPHYAPAPQPQYYPPQDYSYTPRPAPPPQPQPEPRAIAPALPQRPQPK